MEAFICPICGDAYIGEAPPSNCPFCGAPRKYFTKPGDYKISRLRGEISKISRENITSAIKLEDSNSEFYLCASKSSANAGMRAIFRRLSKIEREHATVLRKLIGAGEESVIETCGENDGDNVRMAVTREERAMASYSKFLSEAKEPGIRRVFEALVEIEKTHVELLTGMER